MLPKVAYSSRIGLLIRQKLGEQTAKWVSQGNFYI